MTMATQGGVDTLYRGRKGRIDFIKVPELGYLVLEGRGGPGGEDFGSAFGALFPVAYAAHFLLLHEAGVHTRVMPPESAFWVDGATPWDLGEVPFDEWHWKVMLMQPDPIDGAIIARAIEHTRPKNTPGLDRLRYERWTEGPAAQTIHVGPYDAEGPTVDLLHAAIKEAGGQARLWHHEIYFGDPYRTPPEKLRTLIRQPISATTDHLASP